MTAVGDLLQQISVALGSAISPDLTTASDVSDVFEAYVFALVIEAAVTEGATVVYRDVHGNEAATFVFRSSPGHIYSRTHSYTHAVITFRGKLSLEVHMGVRVIGKSGVLHECDVAVIRQTEAEICRRQEVAPRSSKVPIAIECKFYSTPLQLHLGRGFVGLTTDLSVRWPMLVTNSSSASVEQLLSSLRREWEHNLSPSAGVEVQRLKGKFQSAFQHYKAT